MDYTAVKNEIENDPLTLGYKNQDGSRKAPHVILGILNNPVYDNDTQQIPMEEVLRWAAKNGIFKRLKDLEANTGATDVNRSIATAALLMFQGSVPIFRTDASGMALLNALQAQGVLTAAHKQEIIDIGKVKVGRFHVLFQRPATITDVFKSN